MSFWDVFSGITNAISGIGGHIADNVVNYNIAKENLQYQKDYNNTIWNREDSAMQRRMADLKASGLNPLLAVGTDGAGAGGTASAPSNGFVSNMREGAYAVQESINASRKLALESDAVNAEINLKNAQTENVNEDTAHKKWENTNNALRSEILALEQRYKNAEISLAEYQAELARINSEIAEHDKELIVNSNDTSSSFGKDSDSAESVTVQESGIPFLFKTKTTTTHKAVDYGQVGQNPWFNEDDKAEIVDREKFSRFKRESGIANMPYSEYKKLVNAFLQYEHDGDYKALQNKFQSKWSKPASQQTNFRAFSLWWYGEHWYDKGGRYNYVNYLPNKGGVH